MDIIVLAVLIGIVAGLRAMTAPAAVSWAAYLGWVDLSGTWLSFAGHWLTPWVLTAVAVGELISDQLPSTPSRKTAAQFGARIIMGALSGAAVGTAGGVWAVGLLAGVAGAVIGTLGGAAARAKLAARLRRDSPAAFVEDAVAIGAASLIVWAA